MKNNLLFYIHKLAYYWGSKNWLAYGLWPLSLLYRLIAASRRFLYRQGLLKTTDFPVPVIVVGNITIGGTGKTPLVIYLANWLKQQGYRPGIVSRGYAGRTTDYPYWVKAKTDPKQVGDEAVLICQHTHCPTLVDPNRVRAVYALLAKTNCNIILSDDGLQHYALGRALEIVVIDGQRRFGNGFHLPAGPLREPLARLKQVDFIFSHGPAQAGECELRLIPDHIYRLAKPEQKHSTHYLMGKEIHAVAGIGHPHRFFNSLRRLGLTIIEHPFPDHHHFQVNDFNYGDDAIILLTEKDAVKCIQFADERLWCLSTITTIEPCFHMQLISKLNGSADQKTSPCQSSP